MRGLGDRGAAGLNPGAGCSGFQVRAKGASCWDIRAWMKAASGSTRHARLPSGGGDQQGKLVGRGAGDPMQIGMWHHLLRHEFDEGLSQLVEDDSSRNRGGDVASDQIPGLKGGHKIADLTGQKSVKREVTLREGRFRRLDPDGVIALRPEPGRGRSRDAAGPVGLLSFAQSGLAAARERSI